MQQHFSKQLNECLDILTMEFITLYSRLNEKEQQLSNEIPQIWYLVKKKWYTSLVSHYNILFHLLIVPLLFDEMIELNESKVVHLFEYDF